MIVGWKYFRKLLQPDDCLNQKHFSPRDISKESVVEDWEIIEYNNNIKVTQFYEFKKKVTLKTVKF